jgi:hypothetical protein
MAKEFYQLKAMPGFKMAAADPSLWKILKGFPFQFDGCNITGLIQTGTGLDTVTWITNYFKPLSIYARYERIN